ncbi:Nitrilase [Colletotrichum sp. SAR11_59]|nr:Nitrilase [Colletotrichum sp. SAR11_59]
MRCNTSQLLYGAALMLSSFTTIHALSWYGGERNSDHGRKLDRVSMGHTIGIQPASRLPNIYAVAMQELQELESEPLCHRIAARLLVNNCQLLDGKDDATVLIDSGRQIRDFVDSYAASLAICDLERGSFDIPSGCAPFRENSLAQIPDSKFPRLHVSPQQIDSCLSGLARSDSAWNTWVSYRHKALRFCEAARADNDKTQSIRLHQRLTEVLSKLSEGVEQELEAHLHAINTRATEVTDQLRRIIPDVDRVRDSIQDMDRTLSQQIMETAQASQHAMRNGLEDAQNLQQLLGVLLRTVLSSNAEVAASHEIAITAFKDRTESDLGVVMAALASAAVSSASLQSQMELSHLRVTELAGRQQNLEKAVSPEDNFRKAESYIRNAASQGCALAVLPEYHLTSWAPDHPDFVLSCEQSGSYLGSYQALAKELSISIVPGTIVEPEGEGDDLDLINAAYFIGPDGAILGRYEKKNLWHNERPHLTKGPQPHGAFDTPLGRAGLLVCWDLAFPEAFRELIRDGARIIVCPAFWMADEYKRGGSGEVVNRDSEKVFLENVLVARAFENTAAVVLVNAGGPEGGVERRWDGSQLRYCGVSQVAMPLIGSIGKLGAEEAVSIVEIDLGLLDVAEGAYKVREDMQKEGWHYGYSITKE